MKRERAAKYYHGGEPNLKIGSCVLPPDQTQAGTQADWGNEKCLRDKVYVTSDYQAALLYAAGHPSGKGMLYEVTPIGDLAHDEDCDEIGLSFVCNSAKINRRWKLRGATRRKVLRALVS